MNCSTERTGDGVEVRVHQDVGFSSAVEVFEEILSASWRDEIRSMLILDEGSSFSPTREEMG